jgi:Dyp-type peroxidase family
MIDIEFPLDTNLSDASELLRSIQGNIVKGHGRDFTSHIILKMSGDVADVRSWIAGFAESHVTSAATTRRQTSAWKVTDGPGEPFAMFLLAPDGYRYLGFTDDQLPRPRQDPFTGPNDHEYFRRGMKGQSTVPGRRYNDPPPEQWEDPYRHTIDAMILLADDDKSRLDQKVQLITASLDPLFQVLVVERGQALRMNFPRGELVIEHFGFQDGVSQPIMLKGDLEEEIAARGSAHWDPAAPLSLALVDHLGGYGSFMVYRKLEQNVAAFRKTLEEAAAVIGVTVDEAGALAVGRFKDGTPAVPTTVVAVGADPNDFHFDQDPNGAKCPFHAHIRKTNPRGDVPRIIGAPVLFERARRIVRRGITYGDRPDLKAGTANPPSEGVGLLFMCFQSNLDQFVIQQEGSDSNDFVSPGVGVDATIGLNPTPVDQTWPSNGIKKFSMANMIRMLGGEYFFAPSMAFLRNPMPPSEAG